MKRQLFLIVLLFFLGLISCKKSSQLQKQDLASVSQAASKENMSGNNNHLKIAVVSDFHYMDPDLLQNNGQDGAIFQRDRINRHYALVQFSAPLFHQVMTELLNEKPDMVLIPGDLAKEGEAQDHDAVSSYLHQLQDAGIKVFVVPGHSDINNPIARGYSGNNFFPTATISPSSFSFIYNDFGYGSAIARDTNRNSINEFNSLSYVVEPYPGVRILAIDDAKYPQQLTNPPNPALYDRGGRIKAETLTWIQDQLINAEENNCTVLGLMHHNLIEHIQNQNQAVPKTVIDDWQSTADILINSGLKVLFTGHNHANDITFRSYNGKTLYEIETGSPVTPPSPYRIVYLKNKELDITTNFITTIPAEVPGGLGFTDYAKTDCFSLMVGSFNVGLTSGAYQLSVPVAKYASPLMAHAFMAHLAGDEKISPLEQWKIDSLNKVIPKPDYTISTLNNMWSDLNTKDNKWHIKLTDL